ncbi:hypothetical protein HPB50_027801 [Hyalomma asiaticum]|nr:hypothetical protein HPB50_027801 [Hyalomma asiaticum]
MCDRIDPFTLRRGTDTSSDVNVFPDICYGDIANYLVFSANYLTLEEMKAFKSTEAHNYFTSGWVKGVSAKQLQDDKVLLLGESDVGARPWRTVFVFMNYVSATPDNPSAVVTAGHGVALARLLTVYARLPVPWLLHIMV